jgi:cytochrome d ubiquinol oxidase subunit II
MLEQIPDLATPAGWLPLAFMAVMGLAILAYVILDGFDLGIGILLQAGDEDEKDTMIASIGPFWDANETWLVLGIGILLVAFPQAHGIVLGELYLPVTLMLIGLVLRGVSFDFRVKAAARYKETWDRVFFAGSLLASLSQGYMLGRYVTGFADSIWNYAFAALIGLCLASGYMLLGSAWLIIKTEGQLQQRAIDWAKRSVFLLALGIAGVSLATPLVSQLIFEKWFGLENLIVLWPIPMITAAMFLVAYRSLVRLPARLEQDDHYGDWVPFGSTVAIFVLSFHGLAYSLFPYVVMDRLTIWEAAAAPESLMVIFIGAVIVLPVVVGYSIYAYRIFGGKATELNYY